MIWDATALIMTSLSCFDDNFLYNPTSVDVSLFLYSVIQSEHNKKSNSWISGNLQIRHSPIHLFLYIYVIIHPL